MARQMTIPDLITALRDTASILAAVNRVAPEIEKRAVVDVQTRMKEGQQPDGTQQPPLKHPRKSGNTGPPLIDFGKLRESVTAEVTLDGILVLKAFGPGARWHQETRPFLGLSADAEADICRLILGGMIQGFEGV